MLPTSKASTFKCYFSNIHILKIVARSAFTVALLLTFSKISHSQNIPYQSPKISLKSLTGIYNKDSLDRVFNSQISADIQLVALGEVSHGGYEPMAFKADMIKYLVEKKGYRRLLFEMSETIGIGAMRTFLNDPKNQDTTYISGWFNKVKFTDASTIVLTDLFNWLKHFNDQHAKDQVNIIGFELPQDNTIIDVIVNKFVIPFNFQDSQGIVYKINSEDTYPAKVQVLERWFAANQNDLKAKFDKDKYRFLDFQVSNAANAAKYLTKRTTGPLIGLDEANLFRDSVLAENIKKLSADTKSIIWAHNAHVIRTEHKYMGNYLQDHYKAKYYVIITDFSKSATVQVIVTDTTTNKCVYLTKTYLSNSSTAAYKLLHQENIGEGIFFRKDIDSKDLGIYTNTIDASGIQVTYPGAKNSFDALMLFSDIHPDQHH